MNLNPSHGLDEPAGRAGRAMPAAATGLGALLLVLMAASLPLARQAHQSLIGSAAGVPLVMACGVVGVVVARRKPRHLMGWILLGIGIGFLLNTDASDYLIADYRLHGGSWPLGAVVVLLQPVWAPAVLLCGLAIQLFPDGRLPPNRLRWIALLVAGCGVVWIAGAYAIAARAVVEGAVVVDSTGNLVEFSHPTGALAWWGDAQTVFFPLLFGSWILWLAWQAQRYRRSSGERRLQLKWLLSGAASFTISLPLLFASGDASTALDKVLGGVALTGLAALPISIGVGILKFRLYEIDRLISRTISYAVVTATLVALFAAIVTLTTQVLPFSSPVAVAASTLAGAAAFNPLRLRVQHLVDRRFNRARYDAEETIAAFAERLQVAVDLDTVRDDLLAAARTLQPEHASIWLRHSG